MKNKKFKQLVFIKCPYCGYNNKKENVNKYGTCTGCKKTIDGRAKYKYEMICRLKLWRKKDNGRKNRKVN